MVCLALSQVVIVERVASAPARFDDGFNFPLCKQGVAGSMPATSTKRFHCTRFFGFAFNLFSLVHASCAK